LLQIIVQICDFDSEGINTFVRGEPLISRPQNLAGRN